MPRFVALLRGVNVGKGNRLPMAALRKLLESLGYGQVETLLNSGNAVFSSTARSGERVAQTIHQALDAALELRVLVIVKSAREFDTIVQDNVLASGCGDASRLLVVFAQDPATLRDLGHLSRMTRDPEKFHTGASAAYLHCPAGILQSEAAKALLGKGGRSVTTRNWATVQKLHALATRSTN